ILVIGSANGALVGGVGRCQPRRRLLFLHPGGNQQLASEHLVVLAQKYRGVEGTLARVPLLFRSGGSSRQEPAVVPQHATVQGPPCPEDVSTTTPPFDVVNLIFPTCRPHVVRENGRTFSPSRGACRTRGILFVVMSFPSVKRVQNFAFLSRQRQRPTAAHPAKNTIVTTSPE